MGGSQGSLRQAGKLAALLSDGLSRFVIRPQLLRLDIKWISGESGSGAVCLYVSMCACVCVCVCVCVSQSVCEPGGLGGVILSLGAHPKLEGATTRTVFVSGPRQSADRNLRTAWSKAHTPLHGTDAAPNM